MITLTHKEKASGIVFDAIKRAKTHFANNRDPMAPVILKAEAQVNRYREHPEILEQFISTKWVHFVPNNDHYYIQLA